MLYNMMKRAQKSKFGDYWPVVDGFGVVGVVVAPSPAHNWAVVQEEVIAGHEVVADGARGDTEITSEQEINLEEFVPELFIVWELKYFIQMVCIYQLGKP